MKDKPLISVVIPTLNSEMTLESCLRSVKRQTYRNIEVIIVDSFSLDRTIDIAQKFGEVFLYAGGILGARFTGLMRSSGDFVLLLDSDQILQRSAMERALAMMNKYDMLCLEERSYRPRSLVEKLFEADRKLVFELARIHLDPVEGVLLARFFKRQVLEEAFNNIPKPLFPAVVAHDHAIVYYEAHRVSSKVGILWKAVWHVEPSDMVDLWRKNFRYGRSTKYLVRTGLYRDLLRRKVRFRKGALNSLSLTNGIKSCLLSAIKGVPYQIGYWSGGG